MVICTRMSNNTSSVEKVAVVGLGYVGLPVAVSMAKKFDTLGFDIKAKRIAALREGHDETGEVSEAELRASAARFDSDPHSLADRTFIIVAVPTPIDDENRPDLTPLVKASETIGPNLKKGAVVVYESTVYPGVTEEVCGPILERLSGLRSGVDFFLGYSPERINPGDKEHTFERIRKVVSGQDLATLDRVAEVYGAVVTAGVYRAQSIKVAEAAKVIENTQRDLNIALMNELALIFDRMGIRTADVLAAAGTKWNFLPFSPGLVGGHCIGVDPYYLTTKAEALGYQPEVILAGRRINNGMGAFIANKAIKAIARRGLALTNAKVGILGLTFKENVPDLRNSKVPDIIKELSEYGVKVQIHDPLADQHDAEEEYGLQLCGWEELGDLDVLVYAVTHQFYRDQDITKLLKSGGTLIDVKSSLDPASVTKNNLLYWSL